MYHFPLMVLFYIISKRKTLYPLKYIACLNIGLLHFFSV
jgi:hypothetical protein